MKNNTENKNEVVGTSNKWTQKFWNVTTYMSQSQNLITRKTLIWKYTIKIQLLIKMLVLQV